MCRPNNRVVWLCNTTQCRTYQLLSCRAWTILCLWWNASYAISALYGISESDKNLYGYTSECQKQIFFFKLRPLCIVGISKHYSKCSYPVRHRNRDRRGISIIWSAKTSFCAIFLFSMYRVISHYLLSPYWQMLKVSYHLKHLVWTQS